MDRPIDRHTKSQTQLNTLPSATAGMANKIVISGVCRKFGMVWFFYSCYLARSAKLSTGLYILPPKFLLLFFKSTENISATTGPIFTTFSPHERYLREFS